MLKKKLGIEGIETIYPSYYYLKIPSTLIIPEGCVNIGSRVFAGCEWLEKVEIPGSVEKIGDCAFGECKRAEIIIDRSPNEEDLVISSSAFEDCKNVKYAKEETRS